MAPTTLDRGRRPDPRAEVGRIGERAALEVYRRMGFRVIARNWRCPAGEIDLVVRRGSLLVICEVKTRSSHAFGEGYESVTFAKRRRLRRLAQLFVHAAGLEALSVRFDVASVTARRDERPDVIVFTDAF